MSATTEPVGIDKSAVAHPKTSVGDAVVLELLLVSVYLELVPLGVGYWAEVVGRCMLCAVRSAFWKEVDEPEVVEGPVHVMDLFGSIISCF
jgi:hypothetical protein